MRLCLDVGGTYIKYGLFNTAGQWEIQGKVTTQRQSIDDFFDPICQLIAEIEKTYQITAIGLSFPGFINQKTGEAVYSGAIAPLHGKNICHELSQRLVKTYPIFIENDANCAALAEMYSGNAQETESFVLLTLGTGVGGAIIVDGQVLSGAHFRGGEFGMMVTDFQQNGYRSLHELASTSALMTEYRRVKGDSFIQEEAIFSEIDQPGIDEVIENWSHYVGILIYNLSVTLDPQKILIGGGISQNDRLIPIIEKALEQNPYWHDFKVPLVTCLHHNNSGVLGALHLIETQGGRK
ncbi:ROK family protein [Enterococcus sp.]|uniref:ROK family protein n=1 Tax=Enterococcus sp. TaxID=35783 RepID=UPI002FC8C285